MQSVETVVCHLEEIQFSNVTELGIFNYIEIKQCLEPLNLPKGG